MTDEEKELFLFISSILKKKQRDVWNKWRYKLWVLANYANDLSNSPSITQARSNDLKNLYNFISNIPYLEKDQITWFGK